MPRGLSGRDLFDALCELVEILWAFLADRLYSPKSFLAQRFATAVGKIPKTSTSSNDVEVPLLDRYLGSDLGPTPLAREVQARESPCLQLFPCIFRQKALSPKFHFNLIKPFATTDFAITVHAKNETVRHAFVSLDDIGQVCGSERFDNAAKNGILADSYVCGRSTQRPEEPLEKRLEELFVFPGILRDDQDIHSLA